MASDLRRWETDPLFSAAEVVQDSADRMETIYRLVLHESSLIKSDHPDSAVWSSLNLHRRDLQTAVETTRWQLEDFEKEASLLIQRSKLLTREVLVPRYRHFVKAIREQIHRIEKNLDCSSLRDYVVGTSHGNLNVEEEEDSLESFLSGVTVNLVDHARHNGNVTKGCSILEGFLDAAGASCSIGNTDEIVEEERTLMELGLRVSKGMLIVFMTHQKSINPLFQTMLIGIWKLVLSEVRSYREKSLKNS